MEAEVVQGAPPEPLAIKDILAINPPPPAWHGSFALNGLFTTGNSETQQFGFTFRLDKKWDEDSLHFRAEYSYGRQTDPTIGVASTTVDYGQAKCEHDFTAKVYDERIAQQMLPQTVAAARRGPPRQAWVDVERPRTLPDSGAVITGG